jgi:hypothetical protein
MARMPWLAAQLAREGLIAGLAMIDGTYEDEDDEDDALSTQACGYFPAGGGLGSYPDPWTPS